MQCLKALLVNRYESSASCSLFSQQSFVKSLSAQLSGFFCEHSCREIQRRNKTAAVIYFLPYSSPHSLFFPLWLKPACLSSSLSQMLKHFAAFDISSKCPFGCLSSLPASSIFLMLFSTSPLLKDTRLPSLRFSACEKVWSCNQQQGNKQPALF